MPIPKIFLADFEENNVYHIYNRTNNKEKLFVSDENRSFFLRKYQQYLGPILNTYCWCLLTNHFHFLSRVKTTGHIIASLENKDPVELEEYEKNFIQHAAGIDELVSQTFKRFFQSYAMSFNKMHNRQGNLFHRPFKRTEITGNIQLARAATYIHLNPLKHKLIDDFTKHPWSSWQTLISEDPTQLLRRELFECFGGREEFIKTHFEMARYLGHEKYELTTL